MSQYLADAQFLQASVFVIISLNKKIIKNKVFKPSRVHDPNSRFYELIREAWVDLICHCFNRKKMLSWNFLKAKHVFTDRPDCLWPCQFNWVT